MEPQSDRVNGARHSICNVARLPIERPHLSARLSSRYNLWAAALGKYKQTLGPSMVEFRLNSLATHGGRLIVMAYGAV